MLSMECMATDHQHGQQEKERIKVEVNIFPQLKDSLSVDILLHMQLCCVFDKDRGFVVRIKTL